MELFRYFVYNLPFTLYPLPFTLYPLPFTLYPLPFTLYPFLISFLENGISIPSSRRRLRRDTGQRT